MIASTRLAILCFLLLISSVCSFGQAGLQGKVNQVFEHIYDFRLEAADSLIDEHARTDQHAVWDLMRANVNWWRILSGNVDDDDLQERFIAQLDAAKANAKRTKIRGNEELFTIIIVNAFRTRLDLLNENYLTAVGYLNSCIDDVTESFGEEPNFEPFYLSSGLYYYFMQLAYDDYPLMRPYLFFFPDGDKAQGLSYLERCLKSEDVFLHTEAAYFLMRIYYDLEKNYALAKRYNDVLIQEHPDNVIYLLFDAKIQQALGATQALQRSRITYRAAVESNPEFTPKERSYFMQVLQDELAQKKPAN